MYSACRGVRGNWTSNRTCCNHSMCQLQTTRMSLKARIVDKPHRHTHTHTTGEVKIDQLAGAYYQCSQESWCFTFQARCLLCSKHFSVRKGRLLAWRIIDMVKGLHIRSPGSGVGHLHLRRGGGMKALYWSLSKRSHSLGPYPFFNARLEHCAFGCVR